MEKMGVFLSWSGQRSRAVAEALKKYLPMIVNDLEPWLSTKDIDKGSRSTEEIAAALVNARAGIICLTPNNLKEPWILFEAGAIAKTVREKPLACTLLIGLEISEVSGPLAQFQATKPTKPDMLQMVKDLNKALGQSAVDEHQVAETFELCWPKLKATLDDLPSDGPEKHAERKPEDMLKELVELNRRTALSVLESHRGITEMFNRVETTLEITLGWQRSPGAGRLGMLKDLLGAPPGSAPQGSFGSAVFESPLAPTGTTETLAARTLLRHASQPDEVPPSKPPDSPGRAFRRGIRSTDPMRKEPPDKK